MLRVRICIGDFVRFICRAISRLWRPAGLNEVVDDHRDQPTGKQECGDLGESVSRRSAFIDVFGLLAYLEILFLAGRFTSRLVVSGLW